MSSPTSTAALLFAAAVATVCFVAAANGEGKAKAKAPAVYVFGDSTMDVGNNNYLPGNSSKADFPHYGVDFPRSTPTGRFSNGFNGADFLAKRVGFKRSPPPYLSLPHKSTSQIHRGLIGVNFASAGSGILNTTGSTITMSKQIEDFATLKSQILSKLSPKRADFLLSKSIFIISSGGNDAFAFFSQNKSPNATVVKLFIDTFVSNYASHIKSILSQKLYDLGARKFEVIDVTTMGCCPYARTLNPTGECVDALNELAKVLNDAVRVLWNQLSTQLQGLKYSVGSSYELVSTAIANPNSVGFIEVKSACCGGGKFNAEIWCAPNTTFCSDRTKYLFWDSLHPTQAASKLAAFMFYNGPPQFASPITLKQLVEDTY
ncbi:GDSL esterase/lipase [Ananas comosus]|uniref:GDSL esterase/lipase n=1 Tax=Ananas comosus TaxID=4615 RepID=A0A199W145_ANACO|nr:GDSL esterase/lipase [Ananas comosus]